MATIAKLANTSDIPANTVFFIDSTFWATPFAVPSRDTILQAQQAGDQTVVTIIDVKIDYEIQVNCTLKCVANQDLTVELASQYISNIFNYMSENIDRIFGMTINEAYITSDSDFPTNSSVLSTVDSGNSTVNAGNDTVDPSTSDLTQQLNDIATSVTNGVKNIATGATSSIIIILIIVVIGLFAFAYVEKEA